MWSYKLHASAQDGKLLLENQKYQLHPTLVLTWVKVLNMSYGTILL